ncbi:hypothetical protein P378_10345 [Desulforamulus profundi]|uniref:Aminotransferase class III n=1 Tax=Desulforamulus profundi TaxID=1383067 RepID=A0A2C6MEY1_9FIRM|nr:hypothetical protein P378_10345 [Desulforamulus profundi]
MENLEIWDKEYVWHPFTQMQQYRNEETPIIERGEGSYLFDTKGRKYLDGISSLWVTTHGHCCREINEAIQAQLNKISHSTLLGLANVPSILLAKKLVEITPQGLTKVFYSDSGATAVEIALKIAFQYWCQARGGEIRKNRNLSIWIILTMATPLVLSVWEVLIFFIAYINHFFLMVIKFLHPIVTAVPWVRRRALAVWPAWSHWKNF